MTDSTNNEEKVDFRSNNDIAETLKNVLPKDAKVDGVDSNEFADMFKMMVEKMSTNMVKQPEEEKVVKQHPKRKTRASKMAMLKMK